MVLQKKLLFAAAILLVMIVYTSALENDDFEDDGDMKEVASYDFEDDGDMKEVDCDDDFESCHFHSCCRKRNCPGFCFRVCYLTCQC